eukprot:3295739-Amphidinium_carterae.1
MMVGKMRHTLIIYTIMYGHLFPHLCSAYCAHFVTLARAQLLRPSHRAHFRRLRSSLLSMSRASLKMMFEPKSVAVIGASDKEGKVGNIVMKNMLQAGYGGAVLPITKTN